VIGCDIDGVLTTGFKPAEPDYVILSGRLQTDWKDTVKQIGVDRPIYLRPVSFPGTSQHWKAACIQWLGITKFYEDDEGQAKEIRRICPGCEVVMVRDGKIVGTAA
jgi:hypothetical protein